jgi:hypothetical protein
MRFMEEIKVGGLLAAWAAARLADIYLALQVVLVVVTIVYISTKTYQRWFPKRGQKEDDDA